MRPFYIGQWVDVLDTVNEWLEAQIIDQLYVNGVLCFQFHYKGWKSEYDEYFSVKECNDPTSGLSARLAPHLSKSSNWFEFCLDGWSPWPKDSKTDNGIINSEFQIGHTIDVLDTINVWRVSTVVGLDDFSDGPMIHIHYNGWAYKFDEWIPLESYRLAPHGKHTKL